MSVVSAGLLRGLSAALLTLLLTGAAGADSWQVAGHDVTVVEASDGGKALTVDGKVVLQDWQVFADPPQQVGGVAVITGAAGAGGNACNAAPFVLALPKGAAPELFGPIDSCAYLQITEVQPEAIVFASGPVPSEPGEVWVWNRTTGFTEALPEEFSPSEGTGWDQLATLAGAHPADALALKPVYDALIQGLGPDYPAFAERISGLGSGDLTAGGYLCEACIKLTCDADFAVL